jgi:anaphase-promoting complex subunit 2
LAHEWLYPKNIPSTVTELDRPSETPEQATALRFLIREQKCTAELFKDFLDMVHARFFLVRRDIARYMGQFQVRGGISKGYQVLIVQETEALSVVVQTDEVMKEMLERLVLWQRTWAFPLRRFNE